MKEKLLVFICVLTLWMTKSSCIKEDQLPEPDPIPDTTSVPDTVQDSISTVEFTSWTKDDTSITLKWSKSAIPNFKSYQLYVFRTDSVGSRYHPLGKLLATITNVNDTTYKYSDIYFYYKYSFTIRVVNDEDSIRDSQKINVIAGSFINTSVNSIFDKTRNRFYSAESDGASGYQIAVIDPEGLVKIDSASIPSRLYFVGLGKNNAHLDIIVQSDLNHYKRFTLDLNSLTLQAHEEFTLPGQVPVYAVFDNFILYQVPVMGAPFGNNVILYDITSATSTIVRHVTGPDITAFADNTKFTIATADDSLFIYNVTTSGAQLETSMSYSYIPTRNRVSEGGDFIAIGRTLYDHNFNVTNVLQIPQQYIGISSDGQYIVTDSNEIYSTSDFQKLHKFGDGFFGFAYFSPDNNNLYYTAGGSPNVVWDPDDRLFRYPWR